MKINCTVRNSLAKKLPMDSASSKTLTPQQAADRAGTSRWTINRALKAHELKGTQNNRLHWRIRVEDLDTWAADNVREVLPTKPITEQPEVSALIENAVLKAKIEDRDRQIVDISSDRDAWRAQAQKSVWDRIWGSRS